MIFQQATFTISAARFKQLPNDAVAEVAFIGRSNAGKSSAINAITGQKGLARTSKQPGRTQLINYFEITPAHYLVDLPGYGYAKVAKHLMTNWQHLITDYLQKRDPLRSLILLMDIRHPLMPTDENMLAWAVDAGRPIHILLTKADKLRRGPRMNVQQAVKKSLKAYGDTVSVQVFSAKENIGREELYDYLFAILFDLEIPEKT